MNNKISTKLIIAALGVLCLIAVANKLYDGLTERHTLEHWDGTRMTVSTWKWNDFNEQDYADKGWFLLEE